ncbi:integrase (plasmid) [Rhodococcus sp. USK10]|nr:integrase [Rhodococcus sp. USK10]
MPGVDARIVADLYRLHSASTARNYRQDWVRFASWCADRGISMMPADPEVVAEYVRENAARRSGAGDRMYSIATLNRWVASINYWHRNSGLRVPGEAACVRAAVSSVRGIYRDNGERPTRRAYPLRFGELEEIVDVSRRDATTWVKRARERRDSALLLLGFMGAYRRSELSMLAVDDVTFSRRGDLRVRCGGSHDGPVDDDFVKHVPLSRDHAMCAPCAYRRWLEVVANVHESGRPGVMRLLRGHEEFDSHVCSFAPPVVPDPGVPVFRAIRANGNISAATLSGSAIHAAIRRRAALAGYPDEVVSRVGGQSLRAGATAERLLDVSQLS